MKQPADVGHTAAAKHGDELLRHSLDLQLLQPQHSGSERSRGATATASTASGSRRRRWMRRWRTSST